MRFNIPSVGDQIRLVEDWEFPVFPEYRNHAFLKLMRPDVENLYGEGRNRAFVVSLPAGAVLAVDRIYIRRGKSEFDSVTFVVKSWPAVVVKRGVEVVVQKKVGKRFWAKLRDVNEVVFERA